MNNAVREALTRNLQEVEARLGAACTRSGRQRAEVTLVAVTKTVSPEVAGMLPLLGVFDLAENRPQELWRKAAVLPAEVRWHLIGHLQRNKIERTLPLVHRIHSIDSERLLLALDACSTPLEVFLEFNCSGEESKGGFAPALTASLLAVLRDLKHVGVVGLMTMAPYEEDPQRCRPVFRHLRELRDQMRQEVGELHPLRELSMGMSNDFEIAIEEGATSVRLGTVLFEGAVPEEPEQGEPL